MKRVRSAICLITCLLLMVAASKMGHVEEVQAERNIKDPFMVEATAFCDEYLCDGTEPRENFTIAGMREWLGKTAMIWSADEDGNIGEFMGYYEFHDVGYGQSTGYGESRLLENRSLGTIEVGECIDIWMKNNYRCEQWGRRIVYIAIFDAEG